MVNIFSNIVLIGDAVHSLVDTTAQGAVTSMEDRRVLAKIVGEVVKDTMTICRRRGAMGIGADAECIRCVIS